MSYIFLVYPLCVGVIAWALLKSNQNPMIDGRFYQSYRLDIIIMKVLIIMMIVLFAAAIIKIGESV